MELRWLGVTGLRVSAFSLGTMGFGVGGSTEQDARAQVDLALERGVLLVDTADSYGGGASEEVLGRVLGGRREEVLLSTKVHARSGPGPNDVGQSRWHVLRGCEASLRRLGTDRIDVYHVHGFDGCTPVEETVSALDQLVRDGKVRYVACSNQAAWQVVKALGVADGGGLARYVATQSYYSLVARELEWDIAPMCVSEGLGVLVWSPLAGGLLTDKVGAEGVAAPGTRRAAVGDLGTGPVDHDVVVRVLAVARGIAAERGVSVAQVALNWVRSRPWVSSVILGARTVAQLEDDLDAATWVLGDEEVARLDDASERPLPYPHWFQRQFTAERWSRAGAPPGAFDYGRGGG